MAIDTPAAIAILGAGPMGIETGLYARYLGYDVVVLERTEVAASVRAWGHLQMFSPFGQLCSSLGLAALRAQDPHYRPPQPDARLTGRQWVTQYIGPLSRTDLLAGHLQCRSRVVGVSRQHLLKTEVPGDPRRGDDGFRILVEDASGHPSVEIADIVIDTTGVYGQPNWCGAGGIPAPGEQSAQEQIEYGVPDILGTERARYEGRHVLVAGTGLAAAATIVELAKLVDRAADTRVTWVTHQRSEPGTEGPIRVADYAGQSERQQLAETANQCVSGAGEWLSHRPRATLEAIEFDAIARQFLVRFGDRSDPERFDRIIANVGFRPDRSLFAELQIRTCEVTEQAAAMACHMAACRAADAEAEQSRDPGRLMTSEPNFYILGAKSFGRDARFLMKHGIQQIRDLFSVIGGRADLDLYATAKSSDRLA